jgi:mycothione reductase
VGRRDYAGTAYGWAMEDQVGFAKVLIDPETRQVLGAHILGYQASILIQTLTQGMQFGLTADQMARDTIYPHPALSEVVENALLEGLSQL